MQKLSSQRIRSVRKKVLEYYSLHGRFLPWRKTADPYRILVSEIMLQQTQVDRVVPKYRAFLNAFPTIKRLARASTADVLTAWSGLGYNGRAVRMQKLAQIVVKDYQGRLPAIVDELERLPGIGPYTARAVLIFAHNKDEVTIDTNIRRILIHLLRIPERTPTRELEEYAQKLLPKGKSRDWHNALMDYGATILTARKTGIRPTSTQSPFKGSDRWYRGQILKLLLAAPRHALTKKAMQHNLSLPERTLQHILETMRKDGLISLRSSRVRVA